MSGTVTKVCVIRSLGTVGGDDGQILFFDADPSITVGLTDLSLADAQTVVAQIALKSADYLVEAASAINCQATNEVFHAITHAVYFHEGTEVLDTEDVEIHVWYRRDA